MVGTARLPAWLKRSGSSTSAGTASFTSADSSDGMCVLDAADSGSVVLADGKSCLSGDAQPTPSRRLLLAGRHGWQLSPCLTLPLTGTVGGQELRFGKLVSPGSSSSSSSSSSAGPAVFEGTWAGRDVAVTLLHHDSAAVPDCTQHIRQLVSLEHANVVRTHCGVTFTCEGAYAVDASGADSQPAAATGLPPCAGSSSSGGAASPPAKQPSSLLPFGRLAALSRRRASDTSAYQSQLSAAAAGVSHGQQQQQQHNTKARRSSACVVPGHAQQPGVGETWLVQDACDLGSLNSVALEWQITGESDVTMFERLSLLLDAAQGLKYLHSRGMAHGDLSANNVLVCRSADSPVRMVGKLTNMRLPPALQQQQQQQGPHSSICALRHVSPELQRSQGCGAATADAGTLRASDVYAFGIILWEVFTGQAAYRKLLDAAHLFEAIVIQNLRPKIPSGMPADYQLLLERCWASDPADRPSVDKLCGCLSVMAAERHKRINPHADLPASATPVAGAAVDAAAARGPWARSCDAAMLREMMAAAQRQQQHGQRSAPQGAGASASLPAGSKQGRGLPPRRRPTPAPGPGLLSHSSSSSGSPSRTLQALLESGSVLAQSTSSQASDTLSTLSEAEHQQEDEEEASTEADEAELQEEEEMLLQLRVNSSAQSGPGSARVLLCQPHQTFSNALEMPLPELDEAHTWVI